MSPALIAILIKPLAFPVFVTVVVWPIAWILYKVIPRSRFKVILFRVRSGSEATRRDKVVMISSVVAAYALILTLLAWFAQRPPQ